MDTDKWKHGGNKARAGSWPLGQGRWGTGRRRWWWCGYSALIKPAGECPPKNLQVFPDFLTLPLSESEKY